MGAKEQKEKWERVIEKLKQTEYGKHRLAFAYLGLARAEEQLKKEGIRE